MERNDINNFEKAWLLDDEEVCGPGEHHDPSDIMQRNAAFLLESSKRIKGYNEAILLQMTSSYDFGNYARVIELAYQTDRERRQGKNLFSPVHTPLTRVHQFVANIIRFLN